MAAQRPDFCVSDGDTVYYDGQGQARNVPQAWQAYQKMFGLPGMQDYYRHVGGYFMKDDHDYRFNDADPYMRGRWVGAKNADPEARFIETKGKQKLDAAWLTHEEGIRVFKQVFPLGDKTYRTVRWGRGVQLWMLENRDFRSPNNMPDGPDKSIWGREQKAWLMETLLASDADHRIIISPNPIIGPDRLMKGDNHANLNGFWHEGQAFLDWLKEQNLHNVVLMCGDRHWQYHSLDRRNGRSTHEFSCGPTSDEHTQAVPPLYEGVERPYAASRGGFLSVRYRPDDRSLTMQFHSMQGEPLYQKVLLPCKLASGGRCAGPRGHLRAVEQLGVASEFVPASIFSHGWQSRPMDAGSTESISVGRLCHPWDTRTKTGVQPADSQARPACVFKWPNQPGVTMNRRIPK